MKTNDPGSLPGLTPMLRQYFDLKEQAGGAILFFRMGDFYEIFGPDAEEVAPKMDVVLTSRERGDSEKMPFCGVPHHSVKGYILKLLKQGYKIAIAEQLQDPATVKGLVERGIVKILTPGCIDELEGLDATASNHVLALYECPANKTWTALAIELSTGELRLGKIKLQKLDDLGRITQVFQPKEIWARAFAHDSLNSILGKTLQNPNAEFPILLEPLPEAPLRDPTLARQTLKDCLGTDKIDGFPCGSVNAGSELLAAALVRLKNLSATTTHFRTVRPLFDPDHMILSPTAVRDLELFETVMRRQQEGSLAKTIDRTQSPMGARRIRELMARPLVNRATLNQRLDVVEFLVESGDDKLAKLRDSLHRTGDLVRLTTRIMARSAHPAELIIVRQALANARNLAAQIKALTENVETAQANKEKNAKSKLLTKSIAPLMAAQSIAEILDRSIHDQPTAVGTGCGVFREGWDEELDRCNAMAHGGQDQVAAYEQKLRGETGIGSLKIKGHKTFGLLIEVTRANAAKVPPTFTRRQTMVNCERFSTPQLDQLSHDLTAAQDAAIAREHDLYQKLLEKLAGHRDQLYTCAEALAEVDTWIAFAWLALKENYCRPLTTTGHESLSLTAARHPVVEKCVGKHSFVANNLEMSGGTRQLLITGPNMAGKSTIMRQTALCAILHQAGCFIPAAAGSLPIFDRVFTRVGASDDLSRGLSTFMVEMTEAAEILRDATAQSLVILDEVGRGTSTSDGLAIAAAILEEIATNNRSWTLFATHYHELVATAQGIPSVKPVQTEVLQHGSKVTFTHRLIDGASGSSYGIEVARLAGVPEPVLDRARKNLVTAPKYLAGEAALHSDIRHARIENPKVDNPENENPDAGHSQIEYSALAARVSGLKINKLTPLQALNLLSELQQMVAGFPGSASTRGQGELFPL